MDIDRRIEMWQSKYNLHDSIRDDSTPDRMYFKAMDGVMEKLNVYIRANQAEFDALPK